MTSSWFVLLLAIPVLGVLGFSKWYWHQDVSWREFFGGIGVSGVAATICLLIAECRYHPDTETISGAAYKAFHTPEWVSEEERTVNDYDKDGNLVGSHTETYLEDHDAEWWIETSIGDIDIPEYKWDAMMRSHWEWKWKSEGDRPNYDSGDKMDYFIDLRHYGKPSYPVNKRVTWSNWLEASDSIVKMADVSKKEAKKLRLPEYPERGANEFISNRLVGVTGIDSYEFEQLNARLGPRKKVNVIVVSLGGGSTVDKAVTLRNYWRNGKKNDLVVVFDRAQAPSWCYVFGWAKHDVVKFALQSAVLDAGKVSTEILPVFEEIILRDFKPYPWKEYQSSARPVSTASLWVTFILVSLVLGGYVFAVKTN